jgi:glycosyltransferase involved in cell wall biosynthesis
MQPKIRILFIGDTRMIHFRRWVSYISDHFPVYTAVLTAHDPQDIHADKVLVDKCVSRSLRNLLKNSMKIRKIADHIKVDLVHVHYAPSGFSSLFTGRPLITTVYGGDVSEIPFKSRLHIRLLTLAVLTKSNVILADANDLITIMANRLHISSSKMRLFQWGVDLERFNSIKRPNSYQKKLGIPEGYKAILSFRGIGERYNTLTILNAFSRLLQDRNDVVLVLKDTPGEQAVEYLQRVERRILELDLVDKVIRVPDNISYHEIPELLYSCDIYVSIPNVDGTAMSLLESMACGLIPVISDLPAAREWVCNGKNGYLCEICEESLLEALKISLNLEPLELCKLQELNSKIILERANEWTWMERAYHMYRVMAQKRG